MKPPYHIPSMKEIKKLPKNGFNVISTFSGCGGSCLGFKMAGYSVLWANEFIKAAIDTYRANHPETILDTRDIRKVQPNEILAEINNKEIDVLEGSPPCAAFSTVGRREKTWGAIREYSGIKQRVDDLFFEYIRILRGLKPKVFVAENVAGLAMGKAKGVFLEILKEFKASGYQVEARQLDAQWLGVPQSRQRIIFIGVRNDLNLQPIFPKPFKYQYSITDAWNNIHQQIEPETSICNKSIEKLWKTLKPGQSHEKRFNLYKINRNKPCPAILASHGHNAAAGVCHDVEPRKLSIAEVKRVCSFPDDFILTGNYEKQWERMGRSVPPLMMYQIAKTIQDNILCKIK